MWGGLATLPILVGQLHLVGQISLVGQLRLVLIVVGQLHLDGSSASAAQGIITSDSVLSKMAIFPETNEGTVHCSNESARGWSLCEANI